MLKCEFSPQHCRLGIRTHFKQTVTAIQPHNEEDFLRNERLIVSHPIKSNFVVSTNWTSLRRQGCLQPEEAPEQRVEDEEVPGLPAHRVGEEEVPDQRVEDEELPGQLAQRVVDVLARVQSADHDTFEYWRYHMPTWEW